MLLINARAESVAEKPAFRKSLKHRRCLIIMSGFFEWQHQENKAGNVKQPYYIQRTDKQLMAVASIWDQFKPEPDILIPSCCALTTEANEQVSPLHDRMPWILNPQQQTAWLEQQEFGVWQSLE